jgi:glycosyltransferase involved in cell wall biosynthesis
MHIVTPSQWMKDEVIKSDLLGSFPVSVIPNAVNGIFLQSRNKQEVRGKLGWSEDDVYLLFVAADVNEHIKGFHFLLEAIKSMTNMPKLIVVGRGYEIFSKQGTVVEFVGPKSPEEIATYYAGADAVTIPSLEDNLPGVMLEALASGTPVIGTPVGGLKEHIRDFETGILAKDVSGSAIAEAINAFMLERHQFDEEYIRGYGARFNAEEQASAYLSIYDQLLQGAKQGVI